MTVSIEVRNVNVALSEGLRHLYWAGVAEPSRNGPVLVAPGPVVTEYQRPLERVLFSPKRDANPFFHLMESLWMLAGRNDLAWPRHFNSRFGEYSDDGVTVPAAYGHRWRSYFGFDQLHAVIDELKRSPEGRRAVLAIHSADDLSRLAGGTKDMPCNGLVYFDRRFDALNMTVCCRSNDILWGAYGANAVHFSILQEFMASAVGVRVGVYRQFSNNYHLYTDVVPRTTMLALADECELTDHYRDWVRPYPLVSTDFHTWEHDLDNFMAEPLSEVDYEDPFFTDVAAPMYYVWNERKEKIGTGMTAIKSIRATDWRRACLEWVARREAKVAVK